MAQRSKANGQSRKLVNNFLDSVDVGNSIIQINSRAGRGQKRNQQLYNSTKYENEVSKSTNVNPMKFIEEQRGRNNIVNRSLCYESHNNSIINNSNMLNQSIEAGIPQNQNVTINSALGFLMSGQNQQQKQDKKNISQNSQQAIQLLNKQIQQAQSQPPNQRNMILNLSQMNNLSLQAQQKQAYVQQIVNNATIQHMPQSQQMNQIYTLDYLKSTKSHNSKQSSMSKNKEVTKRSGTTGGTGSNGNTSFNNSELQKQQIILMKGLNQHFGIPGAEIIKSSINKNTGKKKGRNIVQQSHNGISIKKIDKLRASSQLGQFASNNITIDFDTIPSRKTTKSTLAQIQQQQMTINDEISGLHSKTQDSHFNNTSILSTVDHNPSINNSFQNFGGINSLVFSDFKKEHSTGKIQKSQNQVQQLYIAQQQICFELENKISIREKEIDRLSSANDKVKAKEEFYLGLLDELALKDKGFGSVITKIKQGFQTILKDSKKEKDIQIKKTDEDQTQISDYKQKMAGYERILKEMKKQIVNYKSEIQGIKKMESYINLENYQKLINEFNTLYDQYKGMKQVNKKIKVELTQSNKRERTFLKLLKKTKEYGEQASRLELEYEKIFKEDAKYGLSIENLIVDSQDRKQPEMIEKGGVKMPKLDFSTIFIQREGGGSTKNGEESGEEQEESEIEDNASEGDEHDSEVKKDKFEQQKKEFKMRMLQGK